MTNYDLISNLKTIMETQDISQNDLSRALGISAAALSQWMAGKYKGSVAKIEDAVKAFIEREREKTKTPKKSIPFVMTSISKKIFELARVCHLEGEIGVCYGEAGIGKTVTAKEYLSRNSDVIFVEADLGYTAKVLFTEIHKKLGLIGRGLIHEMFDQVVEKLKGSGRLIVIDEAEHLPYRALELLRRVYDKAGVGIVFLGMPRLIHNLRGKRGEYAQLYSRVGLAGKLDPLKSQDTEMIVNAMKLDSRLSPAYHQECHGNTRVLSKLLVRSMRLARINECPLSPEVIKTAAEMLIV